MRRASLLLFRATSLSLNISGVTRSRIGIWPCKLDPPTEFYRTALRRLLHEHVDEIVLIPHSNFAIGQHAAHVAAMATLATSDMDNVTVNTDALEDPSPTLPHVRNMMETNTEENDYTLIHWAHDAMEIQQWDMGQRLWNDEHVILVSGENEKLPMKLPRKHTLIRVPRLSGAEVRRLFYDSTTHGEDLKHLVPQRVRNYIATYALYSDFRKKARTQGVLVHSSLIPRIECHVDKNNPRAMAIYEEVRQFSVPPDEEPDLIVPIGGDGFMLRVVRDNWDRFIPFYGINAGTVGYLLNDPSCLFDYLSRPPRISRAPMLYVKCRMTVGCEPLEHLATYRGPPASPPRKQKSRGQFCSGALVNSSENGQKIVTGLAFNDAWIERSSGQTALMQILINGVERLQMLRGDGVLVSTAAGSTAYAISLGLSPVPVGTPLLALVGSNIAFPSHWKPVHLEENCLVLLRNLDNDKRPVRGFIDSVEMGQVDSMEIRQSRVAVVQLAFSEKSDLQSKLYRIQFPT